MFGGNEPMSLLTKLDIRRKLNAVEYPLGLMTASNDYRRQAAYRRLALTILRLDVPSLIQTLPVPAERSASEVLMADWDRSCDTPRLASIGATRLA
jgi:hypothetical protein